MSKCWNIQSGTSVGNTYVECSAKSMEGVNGVFQTAACSVLSKNSIDCTMF